MKKSRKHIQQTHPRKKGLRSIFLLATIFVISVLAGYFLNSMGGYWESQKDAQENLAEELVQIKQTRVIKDQEKLYIKLMDRVGPEQAQEMLQHSGIPYTGQAHLLNHSVGDYIWRKYGPKGITKCRDYFSSSCYHGFIIRGIGNGKVSNIDVMIKECRNQDKSTFVQCAHALGHGFLAYQGYANLLEALTMCDDTKKRVKDFEVSFCHNGVFMENVWGLHEGKPSPDRWFKESDPVFPCNDPRIAQKYRPECWYNQAQLLSVLYKDNLKVSKICDKIEDPQDANMCFDGLFRGFHTETKNDISKKFALCNKMPEKWHSKCISTQASASFQQGDNVRSLQICENSKDLNIKRDCYKVLYWMATELYTNRTGREKFCASIPGEYRDQCPN